MTLHLNLEDLQAPILAYKHIIKRIEKTMNGFYIAAYQVNGLKSTFLMRDLLASHQLVQKVILDQARLKKHFCQAD